MTIAVSSSTLSGEGAVDARPIRPTSSAASWNRAVALRDEIAAETRVTLEHEKLQATVLVSANGSYPPWVHLLAWIPRALQPDGPVGQERAGVIFTIDCKPFHEHEIVVSARLERGKTKIDVKERPDFTVRDAREWARYALGCGPRPSSYTPWRDAFMRLVALLPVVRPPHDNRIRREFRTRATGARILASISFLFCALALGMLPSSGGDDGPSAGLAIFLLLIGVIGLVVAGLIAHFRQKSVSVSLQPETAPRNLGRVDSWHVAIAGLGKDFANTKRRLLDAITEELDADVAHQREVYTYRLPNGFEERERLVVAKDQGMVHVHVYRFGEDLFVGWYAYLNWAQWGETAPVSTKIRDGREIEFREVRPAAYTPSEFDLMDLSSLSELVHRRLEREIKALMKEKEIEQEIDFKVIRGDRDRALDQERHASSASWSYQ